MSYCFLADLSWQKAGEKAKMILASWAEIVHHSMTCVTLSAMPASVPMILKGLGNVSVELEGGWLSFGLLFLHGNHM